VNLATATRVPARSHAHARERLRALAGGSATPLRLRRVGAVLVAGCLLTGLVGLLGGLSRTEAVRAGETRFAALTADAAELYRSLADADAMATSGFVSGGREPAQVRARYDADVDSATERLMHAALLLPDDDPSAASVTTISGQLAVYTGLVETARTYNRMGLPIGQSYLTSASQLMRTTILPAVEDVRRLQSAALATAHQRGGAFPFAVLLIGIATLAALVDVAMLERRRTHRLLDVGLLVAGAALLVALLWWGIAASVAGSRLDGAASHSTAATALDDARAAVLQARSNESLVLVARSGGSASDEEFGAQLERLLGTGGLLDAAHGAAGTDVEPIRAAGLAWREAHQQVRALDDGGRYPEAVASATGARPDGSGAAFERLDRTLGAAIATARDAASRETASAGSALVAAPFGSAVLAALAAGAAMTGIGRRIAEYR
jgi:hypothetical protein